MGSWWMTVPITEKWKSLAWQREETSRVEVLRSRGACLTGSMFSGAEPRQGLQLGVTGFRSTSGWWNQNHRTG